MSLNFDANSNLSLVRRFHTMKKNVKMCQFYSDSSLFFATNCTRDLKQHLYRYLYLHRYIFLIDFKNELKRLDFTFYLLLYCYQRFCSILLRNSILLDKTLEEHHRSSMKYGNLITLSFAITSFYLF
jgi:hypothetical protein